MSYLGARFGQAAAVLHQFRALLSTVMIPPQVETALDVDPLNML